MVAHKNTRQQLSRRKGGGAIIFQGCCIMDAQPATNLCSSGDLEVWCNGVGSREGNCCFEVRRGLVLCRGSWIHIKRSRIASGRHCTLPFTGIYGATPYQCLFNAYRMQDSLFTLSVASEKIINSWFFFWEDVLFIDQGEYSVRFGIYYRTKLIILKTLLI
jgi:hypothetical protein